MSVMVSIMTMVGLVGPRSRSTSLTVPTSTPSLSPPNLLSREREEAKAERKNGKKREKQEKKREKKEKAKHNLNGIGHDAKAYKGKKSWMDLERGYCQKRKEYEAEQLERSGITEEHEQPVYSQNPSYSSDSTHNSNKRRRHTSASNGCHGRGNIIRIRLPLQKHKKPDFSIGKNGSALLLEGRIYLSKNLISQLARNSRVLLV